MTAPAPFHAVLAWADETSVYLELPCLDGTYHRTAFPLSESGLSRALHLLQSRPRPKALPPAREVPSGQFTANQQASAMRILRELTMG